MLTICSNMNQVNCLFIQQFYLNDNCHRSFLEFMHIYCKPYNMSIKYCFIKYPFGMKWWTSDQTYQIQIESQTPITSSKDSISNRSIDSIPQIQTPLFHLFAFRSWIKMLKILKCWTPLFQALGLFNLQMNCC